MISEKFGIFFRAIFSPKSPSMFLAPCFISGRQQDVWVNELPSFTPIFRGEDFACGWIK